MKRMGGIDVHSDQQLNEQSEYIRFAEYETVLKIILHNLFFFDTNKTDLFSPMCGKVVL